jgi:cold shock protein
MEKKVMDSSYPEEDGSDIFVHYSDIIGDGWRVLQEGQVVEFEVEETNKGLQAVNVAAIDDDDNYY